MLPLSTTTDDGPIYVNAKQYHGIIRRRQSRAKAVLENKVARVRKV
jgi:nuclear transcription factor Y alpha